MSDLLTKDELAAIAERVLSLTADGNVSHGHAEEIAFHLAPKLAHAALEARTPAPATDSHPLAGVCYREGEITCADYDEAIEALQNAKKGLLQGPTPDGCLVCGDDCIELSCRHNPLVLARLWAKHECTWRCFHCGFIATTIEQARDHFGDRDDERPVCVDTAPVSYEDALLADLDAEAARVDRNESTMEGELLREPAAALRESRAREQAEPYRHALEQRLICSNLPLLTGNADADLMRFVFHEQEIAGYFCGQLEKDLAAAIARAEKAEALCAEYRKKADYCAVCGQTVADPPCPMAGDEMNPCTWPAKCLTRVMEARTERDALAADLAAARAELGALGPVEYEIPYHGVAWQPRTELNSDHKPSRAIRVVKEAQ